MSLLPPFFPKDFGEGFTGLLLNLSIPFFFQILPKASSTEQNLLPKAFKKRCLLGISVIFRNRLVENRLYVWRPVQVVRRFRDFFELFSRLYDFKMRITASHSGFELDKKQLIL